MTDDTLPPEEHVRLLHVRLHSVVGVASAMAMIADIDDPDDFHKWKRTVEGLANTIDTELGRISKDFAERFTIRAVGEP